jgi:hypothetical protein
VPRGDKEMECDLMVSEKKNDHCWWKDLCSSLVCRCLMVCGVDGVQPYDE